MYLIIENSNDNSTENSQMTVLTVKEKNLCCCLSIYIVFTDRVDKSIELVNRIEILVFYANHVILDSSQGCCMGVLNIRRLKWIL